MLHNDTTPLLQRTGKQNAAPKRRQVSTRPHVVIFQETFGFMVNISLSTAFCCYKTHFKVTIITREWNVKCLSLVIWHCGKVALRSLPPQKFATPLRWDSDKEFYWGILYFQKVIRLHFIRVNVMTAFRIPVFTSWQCSTAACTDVFYGMSPKTDNKYGQQNVRTFLYRPIYRPDGF